MTGRPNEFERKPASASAEFPSTSITYAARALAFFLQAAQLRQQPLDQTTAGASNAPGLSRHNQCHKPSGGHAVPPPPDPGLRSRNRPIGSAGSGRPRSTGAPS